MKENRWEVELFEKKNGRCPTAEFLEEVQRDDPKGYLRLTRALERLEEHGKKLDRPHVGYLRDKISELRVHSSRIQYRILFFWDGDMCVLMQGIKKKTDRVDDSEIEQAIAFRNEYLEERGKRR